MFDQKQQSLHLIKFSSYFFQLHKQNNNQKEVIQIPICILFPFLNTYISI